MRYPYRCEQCDTRWSVEKESALYERPEPCPECGLETADQDFGRKSVGGYVNSDDSWSSGKLVPQLGPGHPDAMVTSKTQMEKVYRKHGISLDTGHYLSKEAQVKATVPRQKRLGIDPSTLHVGGVIEEK